MSDKELDDILNEIKSAGADKDGEDFGFTLEGESEKKAEPPVEPEVTESAPVAFSMSEEKGADVPAGDVLDSFNGAERSDAKEEASAQDDKAAKFKKFGFFGGIAIACILVIAVIVFVVSAASDVLDEEETTAPPTTAATTVQVTEAGLPTYNPLTGEDDFREKAIGKRPIACVVENSQQARPQWGINDSENPPDIILEGEVEGGETRMLWFYADWKAVPSQIGPMRSARPPYIKFSEMFDSIFIHWGMSKTKRGTNYIGANTVFRQDNVDHINQMTYSGSVSLYGRDSSRGGAVEHTGVLYGKNINDAIKELGFRKTAKQDKYTKFSFADDVKLADSGNSLALTFSGRTHTRDWSYNSNDGMYHTSDFRTDVARKNLIVLFDKTEYISKPNYKNSYTEVYLDYKLAGGKGKFLTNGTSEDITWSVEKGLLVIKDKDGKEISLNKGTTWIGWASNNNGGSVTVK